MICTENKLTGFYMSAILTLNGLMSSVLTLCIHFEANFSLHLESLDYFSLNKFITQVEYCSCSYGMFHRHIKKNSKNLIHHPAFIGFAHFNTITYSCASDTESYYTLTKICLNSFNEYIQWVEESTF